MADVIVLSDDDFSAPASQRRTRKRAGEHKKDEAAKQWDDIFSQESRREKRKPDSDSHRSSQRSSERSSKRSVDKSSGHSSRSHRSSERQSHHSSSRGDKERHRGKRSSSGKSVIELDVSDEDTNSSAITSKKASPEKVSSGKSSKESPSHHHSKKSSNHRHRSKSPNHHHSKKSSHDKSSSEKNSSEKNASEKGTASSGATANGRHSGSRRSLAAELGTSKTECKKDDEDRSSRRDRRTTNGKHSKPDAEPAGDSESSQSKRRAGAAAEAVPAAKRVRLTRAEPDAESDASSAPPEPEPEPCQQSLEELCTLLKPLLSGPELKLEAKVRRRHAAVLALAAGRSGRRQHLTGVTLQSAARLRAEPERCFTVLRGFLEQLDQLKIVASSAQSRTAPAPASAARKGKTGTAGANSKAQTGTAAVAVKVDAGTTAAADKKAAADAAKTSPSAAMNGSDPSVASSEQEEKESRRHRRHVGKLEKTLRRLEREIVKVDEQEVDWEDATGSAYMVGARLKRRYVQVYRYYCKLVGADEEAQRLESRRIRFDGTRYPEINRRIEKFVNQTREFPDFKDVLSLIETANRRGQLKLGPGALNDQAKEAFLQLGALLQKRRRAALVESMDSLAGVVEWRGRDPAAGDAALVTQLAENAASGKKKLNEVFKEFVQRQETAAAERRQKREGASADSDEDEEEEEDDTEEAEESEVTDEELEQQTPKPTGGDTLDSDISDEDGVLSDAEMAEADEGSVKEDPDRKGEEKDAEMAEADEGSVKEEPDREGEESKDKELEGADCAKTEESADDGRKAEGADSGTDNEGGPPSLSVWCQSGCLVVSCQSGQSGCQSGAERVSNAKTETAQSDAEDSRDSSAENKGTEGLKVDATSQKSEDNDNVDLQGDGAAEDTQGCDVPKKSPNVAGTGAEQQTGNGGATEAKNKNLDPVQKREKSGKTASAE